MVLPISGDFVFILLAFCSGVQVPLGMILYFFVEFWTSNPRKVKPNGGLFYQYIFCLRGPGAWMEDKCLLVFLVLLFW